MIKLSKRMEANAAMISPCDTFCDVGCDHGYLSIYLVQKGIVKKAIAMDLREGPLEHAKQNVKKKALEDQIELRLSDGVDKLLNGEADSCLIAGMGGNVIIHILTEGMDKFLNQKELVLQPQSEIDEVRRFLSVNGFFITDEDMVLEDNKFYPIIKVVPNTKAYSLSEEELLYGPVLIKEKHPVLRMYLEKELAVKKSILEKLPEGEVLRRQDVYHRIQLIEGLL